VSASAVRLPNGAVLAIGGKPPTGPWLGVGSFSLLVLAAKENQPAASRFPGVRVLHVPLTDYGGPFTPAQRAAALRASLVVAKALAAGKNVMVTCELGLNRSSLIAGMALARLGMPRERVVKLVRRLRSFAALNNGRFARMVREEPLTRVA
jgi:protein-tyrosine phosphatase